MNNDHSEAVTVNAEVVTSNYAEKAADVASSALSVLHPIAAIKDAYNRTLSFRSKIAEIGLQSEIVGIEKLKVTEASALARYRMDQSHQERLGVLQNERHVTDATFKIHKKEIKKELDQRS